MGDGLTSHQITHIFDVEVERNDDEEEDHRYRADCGRLTGCVVYANSKAEALRRMKRAIDIWLDFANRQFADDDGSLADMIDNLLPD